MVAVKEELTVVARVRRWLETPGVGRWRRDPPRSDLRCLERRLSAFRKEFPDLGGVSASEHLRDAWNRCGE